MNRNRTRRVRYNRADIASTLNAAQRIASDEPVYVFATGLGYTITTEPIPFGQRGYKVTSAGVERINF